MGNRVPTVAEEASVVLALTVQVNPPWNGAVKPHPNLSDVSFENHRYFAPCSDWRTPEPAPPKQGKLVPCPSQQSKSENKRGTVGFR